ncbi:GNAT family N-acetyltransferase [Candidatus Nitrosacidococcus tergens]|uniref:BioF2-like acetyltransferase domain-containing protein n=1 Tax=Candidatus Nitrosacidococcus tergens TaxID=553981 RepID=A0A7G1QBN5_9GAMM|nr:GNAT family N-acetyltransferase [Candidatus Nitrosacidococcus tergens]CAB1277338.1 conserved protein of unknown function [Candidatus Nitrosacidococcus tergens]
MNSKKINSSDLQHLPRSEKEVLLSFRLGDLILYRKKLLLLTYHYHSSWIIFHKNGFTLNEVITLVKSDGNRPSLLRSLPVQQISTKLTKISNYLIYTADSYQRCFVDLKLGADKYINHFSNKTRSTLRRKERKFADACGGQINWREYRTVAELTEFYPIARTISKKTYQENLFDAGLPEDKQFYDTMLKDGAQGAALGYIIFDDKNNPLAYLYCPIIDGVVLYQYLGYINNHPLNSFSPGTVLLWLVLLHLQEQSHYQWFDFTEGGGDKSTGQKARFATHQINCANLWVMEKTLANQLLFFTHRLIDNLSKLIGDTLEKIGVKQKIKQWIRQKSIKSD